ncbi:hypothetical protein FOZ63_000605, partial [Perkinsus olseni]
MGSVADVNELRAIRNWCGMKRMWWISDEIYGCSVHTDCNRPHISALSLPLLEGDIDSPTLVLWGFSKDMALSGMRVGLIMNVPRQRDWKLVETIRHAATKQYSIFSMVSPVAQELCARMLDDEQWLAGFLQISRERLTACKRILCDGLGNLNIPYFEPHAGLFLWCDLTEFIEPDDQDGLGLFDKLKSDPYRMVVSPGSCFFADKPGMMRFCYAWMADGEEACREVVRRLTDFTHETRKGAWRSVKESLILRLRLQSVRMLSNNRPYAAPHTGQFCASRPFLSGEKMPDSIDYCNIVRSSADSSTTADRPSTLKWEAILGHWAVRDRLLRYDGIGQKALR